VAKVPHVPTRGAHGRAIDELAVTADGAIAVSVDVVGSVRLWPSLDGAREPIALAGAPARSLAIMVMVWRSRRSTPRST